MALYDAAFASIVQVTPARGRRAISFITLFGGVASTIFWPIGYWLDANFGWRATLLIFAAINILVCLPLHWFGLARRDAAGASEPIASKAADAAPAFASLDAVDRRPAMLLFSVVMAASAFCYGALAAHLIPVMAATGLSAAAAVWLASFKGVVQTASRLVDLVFGKRLHPVTLGRIALAFLPLSFIVLLLGGASITTGLVFVIVFGVANGLTTIVRGAVPLALFGPKGYGETLGILATPYLVMNALAPTLFAFISEQFGMTTGLATLLVMGLIAFGAIETLARWLARRPARPEQP